MARHETFKTLRTTGARRPSPSSAGFTPADRSRPSSARGRGHSAALDGSDGTRRKHLGAATGWPPVPPVRTVSAAAAFGACFRTARAEIGIGCALLYFFRTKRTGTAGRCPGTKTDHRGPRQPPGPRLRFTPPHDPKPGRRAALESVAGIVLEAMLTVRLHLDGNPISKNGGGKRPRSGWFPARTEHGKATVRGQHAAAGDLGGQGRRADHAPILAPRRKHYQGRHGRQRRSCTWNLPPPRPRAAGLCLQISFRSPDPQLIGYVSDCKIRSRSPRYLLDS